MKKLPIYPRVTPINAKWLKSNAKKFKVSEAVFIDALLTNTRKFKLAKDLFNGPKA